MKYENTATAQGGASTKLMLTVFVVGATVGVGALICSVAALSFGWLMVGVTALAIAFAPLSTSRRRARAARSATQAETTVHCPKCRSTQVFGGRKGFGVRQAAAGVAVAGPAGLAAGMIGAKRVEVACLQCGHAWRPGR